MLALFPATPIVATALGGGIVMFSGDGGNMALVAGRGAAEGGLILIDAGLAERSSDLLAAIAAAAPGGRVATVFNTHWHFDHVGGNLALARAGAEIVAHETVRLRLGQSVTVEALDNRVFPPLAPEARPTRTFTTAGRLDSGAGAIEYTPIPEAHCENDTFLFFPAANLLQAGDLYWNGIYPLIDYSTRGWIGGMAAANAQMLAHCDARTRIIPGHGPLATKADLERGHTMLATLHERLEKLAQEGRSADEAVAAAPTRAFDAAWAGGMQPDAFVRMAYASLLRRRT